SIGEGREPVSTIVQVPWAQATEAPPGAESAAAPAASSKTLTGVHLNLFLANFPRRLPAVLSPFSCDLVLMAHAARISCPSSRIHRSGRVVRIGSSLLSPRGCSRNF